MLSNDLAGLEFSLSLTFDRLCTMHKLFICGCIYIFQRILRFFFSSYNSFRSFPCAYCINVFFDSHYVCSSPPDWDQDDCTDDGQRWLPSKATSQCKSLVRSGMPNCKACFPPDPDTVWPSRPSVAWLKDLKEYLVRKGEPSLYLL